MAASESRSFVCSLKNVRINDENTSPSWPSRVTYVHIHIYVCTYISPNLGYIPFRFVASLHRVVEITLYEKIKNFSKRGRLGGFRAVNWAWQIVVWHIDRTLQEKMFSIEIYNINKNVKKYQRIFQKCRRAVFCGFVGVSTWLLILNMFENASFYLLHTFQRI